MSAATKVSHDQVLDILHNHPEATAADLAGVLKIGHSTAAKHLAALEATGAVRRQSGGRTGGRRVADRWTCTDRSDDRAGTGGRARSAVPVVDSGAAGSSGRLGRGQLRAAVLDYLASRAGQELGPSEIGRALGRSQGAVSNALVRLEERGDAELVQTAPLRYRAASTAPIRR